MLKHVNEENFEAEVINSKSIVLVDFFATWCGPCQKLGPVLEEIAKAKTDFDVAKIDIDEARDLAISYGVEVVPTMMIFKDGQVVETFEGFHSGNEILEKLSKFMA